MTNFQKRHYEEIAKLLGGLYNFGKQEEDYKVEMKTVVYAFERLFESDNVNFKNARFIEAVLKAKNNEVQA